MLSFQVNVSDLQAALSKKVDSNLLEGLVKEKLSSRPQNSANFHKELSQKCDVQQFQEFTEKVTTLLEDLSSELQKKASSKEVGKALDEKSNHSDVSSAFVELQKEVMRKLGVEEFKQFQVSQTLINESLCTENIVARWTYKQGKEGGVSMSS